MPTTIVYPSWDVSGTGSISTIISTAVHVAGSLSASAVTITGPTTLSGTAVHLTTAQFLGTTTFSGTAVFLTGASVSGTMAAGIVNAGSLSISANAVITGQLTVAGSSTFSGTAVFLTTLLVSGTASVGALTVAGGASISGTAIFKGTITVSATASVGFLTVGGVAVSAPAISKLDFTTGFAGNTYFKASGAWSAYYAVEVYVNCKGAATTTNLIIGIYADGGTTPLINFPLNPIASATASEISAYLTIFGTKDSHTKIIYPHYQIFNGVVNQAGQFPTTTFTSSGINAIGVITGAGATTTTMSAADIVVYGRS